MPTVADCLTNRATDDAVAFSAPPRANPLSWAAVVESAWKAGHVFRHYGVHAGATVAVAVGPGDPAADATVGDLQANPEPLFGLLGALSVGARIDLEPRASVSAAVLLAPAAWQDRYDPTPGCTRLAYGAVPETSATVHFERARWSENPVAPPEAVSPDAETVPGRTQTALLERARTVVEAHDLAANDAVGTCGRLTAEALPGAVIAPLLAGATIRGGDGPTTLEVHPDGTVSGSPGTRHA